MSEEVRYTENDLEVIEEYWECIRYTRRTGTVAEGIINKEQSYWERFPADAVIKALRIHIDKYPAHREQYTRGIIRNLAAESEGQHGNHGKNNGKNGNKPQIYRDRNTRAARAADAFRSSFRI